MDNEVVDTVINAEPVVAENEAIEEVNEFTVQEEVIEAEANIETTSIEEATETIVEEPMQQVEVEMINTENASATYDLNSIPEYIELSIKYSEAAEALHQATTKIAELEQQMVEFTKTTEDTTAALKEELGSLREFKSNVERKEKEAMIKSFYMLSDNDKADVIANIDKYSLDDIEAKLSIICVRNKVNFSLDEDKEDKTFAATSYTLESPELEGSMPAWIRAAKLRKENN